jgi:hypothetical protein
MHISLTFSRKTGSGLCSHCWEPVRTHVAGLQNAPHLAAADLPDDAALHGARHNLVQRGRDPSLGFLRLTRQRDQL